MWSLLPTWALLYLLNKIILINYVFSCMILYKYVYWGRGCHSSDKHALIFYIKYVRPYGFVVRKNDISWYAGGNINKY